ncbi:MAG: zinc-dependent metalloprotease [Bacteroidota bacterium]
MRFLLFVALCVLGVAPVWAQPAVFGSVSTSRVALNAEQGSYYDAIHGHESAPRLVTANADVLDAEGEVTFNLDDGVELTMAPDRIERYGKGQFSWFGTVRSLGRVTGQAVVSVRDGMMMGEFSTAWGLYDLKPLGDGLYAMVRGQKELRFESHELASKLHTLRVDPPMMLDPEAATALRGGPEPTSYTVLFPYTPEAFAAVPDIALVAQQVIAFANQAYVNSNVDLRAEFAGIFELDLEETASLETDLRRLQNMSDGLGDAVHAERNRVGADVVTLFRTADETSTAGIAFVCTGASFAFGVFEIDGSGVGIVYTHEVGHIIGGGHEDTNAAGCNSFSRAKEEPGGAWRTIMFASFNSSTVPYFSNPFVQIQIGTEGPVATGNEGTRDNARTFNARAAAVAAFRSTPGGTAAATAQPGSPIVQVVPGTTESVELSLQNTGLGDLNWYGITSASPDVDFHTLGQSSVADLNTSGTELTLVKGSCPSGDALREGFATFDFGFTFPFNGQVYTQARASSNGYVVFDSYDGCSQPAPAALPTAGGPESFISAFWSSDVRPVRSSGGVETKVIVNTLDDGRLTVKWIDAGFFIPSIPGSFFFVDVQAVFGPDGSVEFRYSNFFRTLVGEDDFTLSSGEQIDVPLSDDIRIGIEYAGDDGTEVDFPRLQFAGQIFFPNPAIELTASAQTIAASETGAIPVRINAERLPLGNYTLPLQLLTNDPDNGILDIPIRVQVVTVIDTEEDASASFAFTAIGPNPATDEATLAFELAAPSEVTVTVFDALGREVRQLELGMQLAGAGETVLDTSDFAPGVYLVRLEADGELRTRRVTVVR